MKITVRYLAQLKQAAGVASETLEIAQPCSLAGLLGQLARRHDESWRRMILDAQGQTQPALLIFVGSTQVSGREDRPLTEDATVTLLAPMAGG